MGSAYANNGTSGKARPFEAPQRVSLDILFALIYPPPYVKLR